MTEREVQAPNMPSAKAEDIWESEKAKRFLKNLEDLEEPQPLPELESGFGFL